MEEHTSVFQPAPLTFKLTIRPKRAIKRSQADKKRNLTKIPCLSGLVQRFNVSVNRFRKQKERSDWRFINPVQLFVMPFRVDM